MRSVWCKNQAERFSQYASRQGVDTPHKVFGQLGNATYSGTATQQPPMALLSKSAKAAVSGGAGGYLNPSKIVSGTSIRFALLSEEPVEGYELWAEDGDGKAKSFRFDHEPTPAEIDASLGEYNRRMNREGTGFEPMKFFIALPVYNYDTERVEVMQLNQKGLIREIDSISQSEDWNVLECDFTLGKTGAGLTTEYKLLPANRKKGMDEVLADAWAETQAAGFDLKQVISGGNPFRPEA